MMDSTRWVMQSLLILAVLCSTLVGLLALPDEPAAGFDGVFLSSFFLGQLWVWGGYLGLRVVLPRLLARLSALTAHREKHSRLSSH